MAYLHGMAVANSGYQLLEKEPGLVLAESAGIADPLEELPTRGVLHDDREMRRRQNNLLEPDDVWVPQGPVVDDFPLHVLINMHTH